MLQLGLQGARWCCAYAPVTLQGDSAGGGQAKAVCGSRRWAARRASFARGTWCVKKTIPGSCYPGISCYIGGMPDFLASKNTVSNKIPDGLHK